MFEGWRLDMARAANLRPDGAPRSLTSGEFNMLAISASTRARCCRATSCWTCCTAAPRRFDRSIDVQISRLRRKIETNLKDPSFIKTVRYGGYFFTPEVTRVDNSEAGSVISRPVATLTENGTRASELTP